MSAHTHHRQYPYYHPSDHSQPMAASSQTSTPTTGLPTPAASPQADHVCSPSPSVSSPATQSQQAPRRMHNMSISSILSPDDGGGGGGGGASACPQHHYHHHHHHHHPNYAVSSAAETPPSSSSACSPASRGSVAEEPASSSTAGSTTNSTDSANSAAVFSWNEDPEKIDAMLRTLNPDSAEWVVWKDWADFLAEEKEAQAKEREAAAAAAATAPAHSTG